MRLFSGSLEFYNLKDLFIRFPTAKINPIKGFTPAAWTKAKEAAEHAVAPAA
jgi:hypothetical protein